MNRGAVVVEGSDHNLRRMVARLPSMSKADFDAIMETLSDEQRTRTVALLREIEVDAPDTVALADAKLHHAFLVVPDNLSSWLVARVNGNPAAGDEVVEQFSMTMHATTALRICAAELVPQPTPKSPRPSLFEQLWRRLASERAPA